MRKQCRHRPAWHVNSVKKLYDRSFDLCTVEEWEEKKNASEAVCTCHDECAVFLKSLDLLSMSKNIFLFVVNAGNLIGISQNSNYVSMSL